MMKFSDNYIIITTTLRKKKDDKLKCVCVCLSLYKTQTNNRKTAVGIFFIFLLCRVCSVFCVLLHFLISVALPLNEKIHKKYIHTEIH